MRLNELVKFCLDPDGETIEFTPPDGFRVLVGFINKMDQLSVFGIHVTYLNFAAGEPPNYIYTKRGPKNISVQLVWDNIPELVQYGLNPDLKSSDGESLLSLAAKAGYPDHTSVLLEHGANPNVINPKGETPLASVENKLREGNSPINGDYRKIYDLLIQHGAKSNQL